MIEQIAPEVWLDWIKRLDVLREIFTMNIERTGDKQEKHYNERKIHAKFKVSDIVMRRMHVLSDASKFNAKLDPKFKGPFQITEVKSPTVYVMILTFCPVDLVHKKRDNVFTISRLNGTDESTLHHEVQRGWGWYSANRNLCPRRVVYLNCGSKG